MRLKYLVLFLLIASCVDPLEVDTSQVDSMLIVDGLVTDRYEPYEVKLYYSHSLRTGSLRPFDLATRAHVEIVDDLGHRYTLSESEPGIYHSNPATFVGEIGRSYFVNITIGSKQYQSEPQMLTKPGSIENISFEFVRQVFSENGVPIDGLEIYVDAKGVEQEDNLLRWRWTTVHQVRSFPERHVTPTPGGDRPTPEPCSGYIATGGRLIQVGECTCCTCWSYNYSEGAHVSKNMFVDQLNFNKQFLGRIPVTAMHFYDRYHLKVEQLSLSGEAYDFWNLIEKQQQGATDLFQPNAIKVRGNVKCITNPDEEVIGLFGVSGVTSYEIFIPRSEIPVNFSTIDTIGFSCMSYFKNPTTQKPIFW